VRAVLQRVTAASVTVDAEVVSENGPGLLLLDGVKVADSPEQARALARKAYGLRILDGSCSGQDIGAPVLVVSQFTLYADTNKGRRPSWNAAASGPEAQPLIDAVAAELVELGAPVQTGVFGAHMQVALVNDGPVTIILDV
jgi:D-tyrosyl-tRNA(Tyr) deacylase